MGKAFIVVYALVHLVRKVIHAGCFNFIHCEGYKNY